MQRIEYNYRDVDLHSRYSKFSSFNEQAFRRALHLAGLTVVGVFGVAVVLLLLNLLLVLCS